MGSILSHGAEGKDSEVIQVHYTTKGLVGFEISNRSNIRITPNLRHKKGEEIFYKLIDKANIFYTNYREKILRELVADYKTLSKTRSP
ncbi:MAG: hypothetical protein FJ023_01255 [Chloroflexi bacterium]|nr:hypothetical protein [Chloroflexota bacterium]